VITRQGQPQAALVLAGDRVVGQVRAAPVALSVTPARIWGKLGYRNVWLWLHGHDAEGTIGGAPVRFELVETAGGSFLREGYFLAHSLPRSTARVAASATTLSWFPGCGAGLTEAPAGAGVYEGRCASGGQARVTIPPGWRRLPPLERMILLSFFLGQRDPLLDDLFGRDGPHP
jgi:hypothetical protein